MDRAGAILRLAPVTPDPGLVIQPIAALVHVLGAAGDVCSSGVSARRAQRVYWTPERDIQGGLCIRCIPRDQGITIVCAGWTVGCLWAPQQRVAHCWDAGDAPTRAASGKHPRPPCDPAWAEILGAGAKLTVGLRCGVLRCWVGLVWLVWSWLGYSLCVTGLV